MPVARDLVAARWAIAALFFVNGALVGGMVPFFPAIKESLRLSASELGLSLLFGPIGGLFATMRSGRMVARHGSKPVIVASALLLATAIPLVVAAPSVAGFRAGLLFFGLFVGAMEGSMNSQAVTVQHRYPRPMLSVTHGCWSLGGFMAAWSVSLATGMGVHRVSYSVAASALLALVVLIAAPRLLPAAEDQGGDAPHFAVPRGPLVLIAALCVIAFAAEGSAFDWAAIYLREVFRTSESTAALAFAAFSACMAAGRMVGDVTVARLGHLRSIQIGSAVGAAGLVLVAASQHSALVIAGFALAGIGLANVVPILFQAAGSVPGIPTGTGIAAVTSLGFGAFFFIPPTVGFVADHISLSAALGTIGCLLLLLTFLSPRALAPARMAAGPPAPPSFSSGRRALDKTWGDSRARSMKANCLKIVSDDEGFEVRQGDSSLAGGRWQDVERVVGYKLDHMTVDTICLDLEMASGEVHTLTEDDEGFWALGDRMVEALGIDPGWKRIAQPPFAANLTTLFERTQQAS